MSKCSSGSSRIAAKRGSTIASPGFNQRGFTMVELLVAMVISLLIALAAIAALTVTRQGFTAVDASSQLRDNGRFISDLIQRLGVQSGFKDTVNAAYPPPPASSAFATDPAPNITGFNNALASASDPLNVFTARTTGDGSDILILRYQAAETFPGSGKTDLSMIDCAGISATTPASDRYNRMASVLHVQVSTGGEPALMCTTVNSSGTIGTAQPIISGVENFQVLYGVDGVTAGTAPPAAPVAGANNNDTVPESYLRADQLVVAGNAIATNANWRRVRSMRIGIVLRGPVNSAQDTSAQTYYPFGPAPGSSGGAKGSALSSSNDPGTVFAPTADGRLRQVVTFTVHLRNEQGL